MAEDALLTVREAARLVQVPKTMVLWWIEQGHLRGTVRADGEVMISLAAVRALIRSSAQPAAVPTGADRTRLAPDPREYVPPFIAARLTGLQTSTVSAWSRRGRVTTIGGIYGRLVRLADVQALAEQRRGRQ